MDNSFEKYLNPAQAELVQSLVNPHAIQAFLDSIPYSAEHANRCPLQVLQDRKAHCLDGALFAAAALRRLGYPPLVVDLLPEPEKDDDHVLAIFTLRGGYGAVAKSNYVGLRYREPVYRTLRELVMSYFEQFFNLYGEKTLRYYTRPINLARFDRLDWAWKDEHLDVIERYFSLAKRHPAIKPEMAPDLSRLDRLSLESGMMGCNPEGLYQPGH